MSQLNFAALSEPENQLHHRNAKQFGASDVPRSTKKKTALTDVKNILAQRTAHSAKKPPISETKLSITKKKLIDVFNKKENDICKKEVKRDVGVIREMDTCTTSHSVLTNEAKDCESYLEFEQPVCSLCNKNKVSDDYADILMKAIRLTKNEIDILALEWERQPVVGIEDMRKLEIPTEIPIVDDIVSVSDWPGFDYEHNEPDIDLLCDIPIVESVFDSVDVEE